MLTQEQINSNKEKFINLLRSINVDGANIEGLISSLENSDFFDAPASTKYHGSYAGGLCEHSLIVYENLYKLIERFASHYEQKTIRKEDGTDAIIDILVKDYDDNTIKIVGLLHDLSKTNFYEKYSRNVKVDGQWTAVEEYKVRDPENRLLAGSKGFNSFLLASSYIPLNKEEVVAIVNQYVGMDKTENTEDIHNILGKYNLTVFLHTADLISCYCNKHE